MLRVAFLHGFLGGPEDWDDVCGRVGGDVGCSRIALADLDVASVGRAASSLGEILAASPCDVLVGYSMGGRIALELAATERASATGRVLVPRLVLLSASPGIDETLDGVAGARTRRAEEDDARARELLHDGLDAFVARWYAQPLFASFAHHPSFAAARARRARGDARFWARCIAGCSPGRATPRWDALAALAPRVTLAAGALDERYAALASRAAALAPALRVEIVACAGHALPLEAPEACARIVREALGLFPKEPP